MRTLLDSDPSVHDLHSDANAPIVGVHTGLSADLVVGMDEWYAERGSDDLTEDELCGLAALAEQRPVAVRVPVGEIKVEVCCGRKFAAFARLPGKCWSKAGTFRSEPDAWRAAEAQMLVLRDAARNERIALL